MKKRVSQLSQKNNLIIFLVFGIIILYPFVFENTSLGAPEFNSADVDHNQYYNSDTSGLWAPIVFNECVSDPCPMSDYKNLRDGPFSITNVILTIPAGREMLEATLFWSEGWDDVDLKITDPLGAEIKMETRGPHSYEVISIPNPTSGTYFMGYRLISESENFGGSGVGGMYNIKAFEWEPPISAWNKIYTASVLPENDGFTLLSPDTCTHREIHVGNIFHSNGQNVGNCLDSADVWSADAIQGFTIEAKLQVLNGGSLDLGGIGLWGRAPTSQANLIFHTSGIEEYYSGNRYLMDTTDNFHKYRISVQGFSYEIFVDDVLRLSGSTGSSSANQMLFGDGSGGATGEVLWDCVAYTTSGSFSPSELASACT